MIDEQKNEIEQVKAAFLDEVKGIQSQENEKLEYLKDK
jgi:hypothetical protein